MVNADLRMIPTVTTVGPIGRTLSAIRRELIRLRIQKTSDFVANETPQGTILVASPPKVITQGPPKAPRYKPFLSEGSARYFISPWIYGYVAPVIQVGERQYRGFALTGGSKSIVATMMLRATATRNAAEDYDPENSNPQTYGVLNSVRLIHTEDAYFSGRQTSFEPLTGFPGLNFGGQNWFFPIKLVDAWDEPSTRISADDIIQTGNRKVPLGEGEQDNPWYPTEFEKDFTSDILVGFIHQTGTVGSNSGYILDGFGTEMVAMPEETEITGGKEFLNDQPYPYWHSEIKLDPRVKVPICNPDENGPFEQAVENFGYMLRNRGEVGYPPDTQYPGSNPTQPIFNQYQRQTAFMLPILGISYEGNIGDLPISYTGGSVNSDSREIPSCL